MPGFIKKKNRYIVDACKGSQYFSGFESTRVQNMPRISTVLQKMCTIDAWQDSEYSSDSEYSRVTQGSQQNAPF